MRAVIKLLVVVAIGLALSTPKPGPKPGPRPGPPKPRPPAAGLTSGVRSVRSAYDEGAAGGGGSPNAPKLPPGVSGWSPEQAANMPNLGSTKERENHILHGEYGPGNELIGGGHAPGGGGGTEFPKDWAPNGNNQRIMMAIEEAARNPDQPPVERPGGGWKVRKVVDGVEIEAILNKDGTVWTAYPLPTQANRDKGVVVNDPSL